MVGTGSLICDTPDIAPQSGCLRFETADHVLQVVSDSSMGVSLGYDSLEKAGRVNVDFHGPLDIPRGLEISFLTFAHDSSQNARTTGGQKGHMKK